MNRYSLLLLLVMIAHILIIWKLIFFPYPEFFVYPYLHNNGLKPYGQILDQHFPGLMFLPINFNNLGMLDEIAARWWLIGIILLVHLLLFLIGKEIFKSAKKAFVLNLLYIIWQPFFEGWTLWIDNFLPVFLLPSFYFYLKFFKDKKNLWLLFLAGLFLGFGMVFKQVIIPLSVILFVLTIWRFKDFKTTLVFTAGLLPPMILTIFYLWKIHVLADFWYWTIIFNATTFAEFGRKLPSVTQLIRVGIVLGFSGLLLFEKNRNLKLLLSIFIIASLASINARFDFVHFQPALPFVVLGTVIGFYAIWERKYSKFLIAGYFLILSFWLYIFYLGHISNKVFFFDPPTKLIVAKIKTYTKPGDKIFIFGSVPHLYQMSQTLPAGDIFVFQFPWFLMIVEDRVLEGIKKDNPEIVVSDRTVEIDGSKITDYAKKIDTYIQKNYLEIDRVDNAKVMRRKAPI